MKPSFRTLAICSVLLLALIHTWSVRYEIKPDGVSYVDMARAMSSGNWNTAQNSVWSPLYPALIAVLLKSPVAAGLLGREWVLAHIATFLLFAVALIAFIRFWNCFEDDGGSSLASAFGTTWFYLGLLLYALNFIPLLELVTPDFGVAAVVFLTCRALYEFNKRQTARSAIQFGFLLAIGYYTKAVLFPLGVLAIAIVFFVNLVQHRSMKAPAATAISFLLLSAPLLYSITRAQGHLSFGESGRLVYAWNVNGERFDEFSRIPIGQRFQNSPASYQVPTRVGVTYAPWYDPSILGRNIKAGIVPRRQLRVLYANYKVLRNLCFFDFGPLLFVFLTGSFLSRVLRLKAAWPLLLYSFAALGLYSMVLIEARYIAPFVLAFFASLAACIPIFNTDQRFVNAALTVALAIFVFLGLPTLVSFLDFRTAPSQSMVIASEVAQLRLQQGDKIAVVGDGISQLWPQLLHLSIAAEVPESQASEFWRLSDDQQLSLLREFRAREAKVAIAARPSTYPASPWTCFKASNYCYFDLRSLKN